MTEEQLFAACVALAADFRIGVEYLSGLRRLVWRGKLAPGQPELNGSLTFTPAEVETFEARYRTLLVQAYLTLRKAAGA